MNGDPEIKMLPAPAPARQIGLKPEKDKFTRWLDAKVEKAIREIDEQCNRAQRSMEERSKKDLEELLGSISDMNGRAGNDTETGTQEMNGKSYYAKLKNGVSRFYGLPGQFYSELSRAYRQAKERKYRGS